MAQGEGISYQKSMIQGTKASLALHRWCPAEPRAYLFFLHGIQSHGGWLYETGNELAQRGVAAYCLDREGSGYSEGTPGTVHRHTQWFADYENCMATVHDQHPNIPSTLVGWSMGGGLLAGMVAANTGVTGFDRLVFSSPALGQFSLRGALGGPSGEQDNEPSIEITVPLRAYTEMDKYLRFIEQDPLRLTRISPLFRHEMKRNEMSYIDHRSDLKAPVSVLLPAVDKIIDLELAESILGSMFSGKTTVIRTDAEAHLLDYSSWRHKYWDWLANHARS